MTLRVIVIDDHAIVRRGIVEILTERSELKVVSEAADYGQLRTQLRQHEDVDLLVMDLSLPGKDGIEILKALHGEYPRLKALIDQLAAPEDGPPHERLSDREFQVLKLIASGQRLSDIAGTLSLSPKTVSVYRARILEKMSMGNNSELVHYAVKHGLA